MNGENYNTESARSYLLGSLPEQETLRYDELSFLDDGFDTFLRNVENDLVDSYVNGSLDAVTSKKFESFYMATPKRRQKVAFARAFYQHADRDPTMEPTVVKASEIGFWEKLQLALRPATLAFGAVALLCLVGAIWLIRNQHGPQQVDVAVTEPQNAVANIVAPQERPVVAEASPTDTVTSPVNESRPEKRPADQPEVRKTPEPQTPRVPVVASFVLTPPLRGAGETKSLKLAQNTERAAFRLELEPVDYNAYKVELLDQTSSVVWNAGKVKARGDQMLSISVTVPAATLKPQRYVFRVSGIAPDGTEENIGDYAFRIVR
jgi:hypothetical protein